MNIAISALAALLAVSGGAYTGYHYRPAPPPQPDPGIPVWVTSALSAQHEDNARLYDRLGTLTRQIEASQAAQASQAALMQRMASNLDVMAGEVNARQAADNRLRRAAGAAEIEARKH